MFVPLPLAAAPTTKYRGNLVMPKAYTLVEVIVSWT
jgi:hypothetical protein